MKREAWNKGLTKETDERVKKHADSLSKVDTVLNRKLLNKRVNAEKEGIKFQLTLNEVKQLLSDAGITSSDWSPKGFHLARIGDMGDYIIGNCRFIPYKDNYAEMKTLRDLTGRFIRSSGD